MNHLSYTPMAINFVYMWLWWFLTASESYYGLKLYWGSMPTDFVNVDMNARML